MTRIPLLILIVLLAVIVGLWFTDCCIKVVCEDDDEDPDMIIEHEDLVAFTQINNSFSSKVVVEEGEAPCSGELSNYWSGLLFHLGDYEDDCNDYQGVRITLEDGTTHDLNRGDFQWINIVSRYDRNKMTGSGSSFEDNYQPMAPGDVVHLMPTTTSSPSEDGCWSFSECRKAAPLHVRMMAIPAIITYWQGADGYSMEAAYDAHPDDTHNSYTIDFKDEYEVWVYEVVETAGDPCEITEKHHFANVKEIRIIGGDGGSGGGIRMDPPVP